MSRYLVVAHQTASSPELLARLKSLAEEDNQSEFVLLIPATPIHHLIGATIEAEAQAVAQHAGQDAANRLRQAGIKAGWVVGDGSPLLAVQDELREHPDHYDAMVVCTFPVGISRWLGIDLPHQLERKYRLPVIHVVAQATKSST